MGLPTRPSLHERDRLLQLLRDLHVRAQTSRVSRNTWSSATRHVRICLRFERRWERALANEAEPGPPITPEDTLREAGISSKRQAQYQRRMSSLLAGRQ
jgi:hypothetical protein